MSTNYHTACPFRGELSADNLNTIFGALDQQLTNISTGSGGISPDINGGTIDGAIIGGSTPAGGNFTTLVTTGTVRLTSSGAANVYIEGSAGQSRNLILRTGSQNRWAVYANSTAESGANVGSDLVFGRYNDAGAFIDAPLTIFRSTGIVAISTAGITGGTIDNTTIGQTTPQVATFSQGIIHNTSGTNFFMRANAGTGRNLIFQSIDGTPKNRWIFACTNDAESGSNAGSNFALAAFNDAGSFINYYWTLNRATGLMDVLGAMRSGGVISDADPGSGISSTVTLTGVTDTPSASLSWGGVGAPNGYIKLYVGTQAVVVPYWNT